MKFKYLEIIPFLLYYLLNYPDLHFYKVPQIDSSIGALNLNFFESFMNAFEVKYPSAMEFEDFNTDLIFIPFPIIKPKFLFLLCMP